MNIVNNEKKSYHIQRIFARQVGAEFSPACIHSTQNPKTTNSLDCGIQDCVEFYNEI